MKSPVYTIFLKSQHVNAFLFRHGYIRIDPAAFLLDIHHPGVVGQAHCRRHLLCVHTLMNRGNNSPSNDYGTTVSACGASGGSG